MDNEEKQIVELQNGSRTAFRSLFSHYHPRLIAYASTLVEEETAEDIIQDVFLYVWEHRTSLQADKSFQAYLYQLAYSRCIDQLRKNAQNDRFVEASQNEHIECPAKWLTEGGENLLEQLYQKDFYRMLYDILKPIPPLRREVFFMAYKEGMKAKEIADQVKIPVRTVESHIYLSVKYLKNKMKHNCF